MAKYDIQGIKNLYSTIEEMDKVISNCIRDINFKEQFTTKEAKASVIRLKEFLQVLENIKKGYEESK